MSDDKATEEFNGHMPATGPMTFIPWNSQGGWNFCSCGKWHWATITPSIAASQDIAQQTKGEGANENGR